MSLLKRALDIIVASLAVVLLLPIGLIIALLIYMENPGPIFFVQRRAGKDGQAFRMFKFRSMYVNDIDPMTLGPIKHNHSLVTQVGHIIRRTKLDEIPQFLNVLRGEMSLVGPRPCIPKQYEQMNAVQRQRFAVSPGITGWAEVNGNVELDWDEQVLLDLWYVENTSFWLDITILFKTIPVMIFGSRRNRQALSIVQDIQVLQ